MSDQEKKIKQILDSIKIKVDNIEDFEKEVNSVLGMFNEIKDVNIDEVESNLIRKKIKINDLREDIPVDSGFRKEMRGNYFKVPNVSKKK